MNKHRAIHIYDDIQEVLSLLERAKKGRLKHVDIYFAQETLKTELAKLRIRHNIKNIIDDNSRTE